LQPVMPNREITESNNVRSRAFELNFRILIFLENRYGRVVARAEGKLDRP
jgi:hypothetical protein